MNEIIFLLSLHSVYVLIFDGHRNTNSAKLKRVRTSGGWWVVKTIMSQSLNFATKPEA